MVSKVIDSSITLLVSSTSSTHASYKDILCHGYILGALLDNIYKIFFHTTSAEFPFYLALYASVGQEPKHIMAWWHFCN